MIQLEEIEAHLGRIRPRQEVVHTHDFSLPIKEVSRICNCTELTLHGDSLTVRLIAPSFSSDMKNAYSKEALQEGFAMSRIANISYTNGQTQVLRLKFTLYMPAE